MEKGYRYLPLLFMLILVLAPIGFRAYLQRLLESEKQHFYVHFHAVVMTFWCIILIAQPLLILKRKMHYHKQIGRFSYVFVPVLVISMFMMLFNSLVIEGKSEISVDGIENIFFPFTQILIFMIFYVLAIWNRSRPRIHMRYIIVSSVSLLGPTVGRIDFEALDLPNMDWDLLVMEGFLLFFLIWDALKSKAIRYYGIGLLSFLGVHMLLTFNFQETEIWSSFGLYLSKVLVFIF